MAEQQTAARRRRRREGRRRHSLPRGQPWTVVPPLVRPRANPRIMTPAERTLCSHIDWHLEAGLAVVFAEAPAAQRAGPQSEIITAPWLHLCPIYDALPKELQ